jgi:protein O-mannosyl-transferase
MGKHSRFVFFGVLIITALIFSGSLKLEWTNWDDDLYVYKNPVVSEGTIKDIFTKSGDYNMYVPLVIDSFALEWKMVKDTPFLYHLDNVLLHLFCTALALLFFRRMGLSVWWSGFAALLFGIHPLRVESVAWITERKDLLYALFYLAALLVYIRYIVSGKKYSCCLPLFFSRFRCFPRVRRCYCLSR